MQWVDGKLGYAGKLLHSASVSQGTVSSHTRVLSCFETSPALASDSGDSRHLC